MMRKKAESLRQTPPLSNANAARHAGANRRKRQLCILPRMPEARRLANRPQHLANRASDEALMGA